MVSTPPWTLEQVASLNAYQASTRMHPFTCGNSECRAEHGSPLFATPAGWVCPHCPYAQFWAHPWMTDGSWMRADPGQAQDLFSSMHWPGPVPDGPAALLRWDGARHWVRAAIARQREEHDRAEWIEDVKQRLGLVTAGDWRRRDPAFAGWPVLGRRDWPTGCRCVVLCGERLSAGCPVHDRPWSEREISNCDPGIPGGLVDDLRAGMVTHHNGWNFNGHLWWDQPAGLFREEVFCYHVSRGVRSAPTLPELVRSVNDEFGWS